MTSAVEPDDARRASPASRWALLLSTAVLWCLLEALSHILDSANIAVALITAGVPGAMTGVAARLLPLVALIAPALPLGAHLPREKRVVRGAIVAFAGAVAQGALPEPWRSVAAMAAFAGGSWYLARIVGVANRRAVAGGMAGAFLLRELIQHAGWLVSLPGRESFALALVVAVVGATALRRWWRAPGEERADSFERRAGGVRLRGALALGALLFFELGLGMGVRAGMWPPGALLSTAGAAAAWLVVVRGVQVQRHRLLAVSLSVVVALCALVMLQGAPRESSSEVAAVLGHAAALLLLERALAPVSGRRSGGNLAAGLALVAALALVRAAIWSAAPMHSPPFALALIPMAIASLTLLIAMYLTPRPAGAPPALSKRGAFAAAAALPVLAALLALD